MNLVRVQFGDAVSIGFKIIDKKEVLNIQPRRQLRTVQYPGQVRQLEATMADWAGHAEAGSGHFRVAALSEKLLCDYFESCVFLRRKLLVANMRQLAIFEPVKRQVDFRAAHIPGENHRAISSLPTFASAGGNRAAASLS